MLIEVQGSNLKEPKGKKLRELFEAVEQAERLGTLRSLAVHGLAALGILLWFGVVLPEAIPPAIERLVILGFAGVAVAACVALGYELHWQRVQRRCMEETGARRLEDVRGERPPE